ncbi:2-dehydro-3-deoxyphosphooctonate aldolase [Alkalitalea saponilacus]|nr:2-dehydro-3-deoxyphosphooctonate aldolase [Alkalitalea saponilacus]
MNDYVLLISHYSDDPTYGYAKENPVMTGGGADRVLNQRRYLNALTGPEGQYVSYRRLGSCCMFKTKNGTFGDTGLLDMYELTYDGIQEPVILYINMYDSDTLQVPVGFRLIYE